MKEFYLRPLGKLDSVVPLKQIFCKEWYAECRGNGYRVKSSTISRRDGVLYEVSSECIASRLAIALGFSCVPQYDMGLLEGGDDGQTIVCYRNELKEDSLIYYDRERSATGLHGVSLIETFSPDAVKKIQDLILFDFLIGNSRHLHDIVFNREVNDFVVFNNGAGLGGSNTTSFLESNKNNFFGLVEAEERLNWVSRCALNPISLEWLHGLIETFHDRRRRELIEEGLINNFRKVESHFGVTLLSDVEATQ